MPVQYSLELKNYTLTKKRLPRTIEGSSGVGAPFEFRVEPFHQRLFESYLLDERVLSKTKKKDYPMRQPKNHS